MRIACLLTTALLPAITVAEDAVNDPRFWAQWRGPRMSGISPSGNPPIEWSETNHVAWKSELPGLGSSTPVIWEDRLFVLTAVPAEGDATPPPKPGSEGRMATPDAVEQAFKVFAMRRSDGGVMWERTVERALPHEGKQPNNSYSSASAVTDGEHLLAYFGSWGLHCFDLEGNLLWAKDFGDMRTRNGFGEGATPALYGDTVVVNWDHEEQSFIVALNKRTGEERWRANRDEITTWGTPLVVPHEGRAQVITTGTHRVRSYDLETGKLVWDGDGLTLNAIPSPVEKGGIVYLTSGFRGSAARAVRIADAKGDVTGTPAVLWEIRRDTPYVPSPLLYDDYLYLIKSNSAILTTLDARTGQAHYGPVRLEGLQEIYASPVGVAGRVYLLGRDGNALVIKNGPELEILATNALDDGFDASPAIVGNELYLRGYRHLYRISQ